MASFPHGCDACDISESLESAFDCYVIKSYECLTVYAELYLLILSKINFCNEYLFLRCGCCQYSKK